MQTVYKVLAYVVALLVVVQSAAMVFAVAGLGIFVDEGNNLNSDTFDADSPFTGYAGFVIHGMNGLMVIPLVALALVVVSFFAKFPGAIRNAVIVLGLVVLQIALGIFGHENAYVGMLHGINALVLFAGALHTARTAGSAAVAGEARTPTSV